MAKHSTAPLYQDVSRLYNMNSPQAVRSLEGQAGSAGTADKQAARAQEGTSLCQLLQVKHVAKCSLF